MIPFITGLIFMIMHLVFTEASDLSFIVFLLAVIAAHLNEIKGAMK